MPPFDTKASLHSGYENIVEECGALEHEYDTIDRAKSFECWIQRNAMKQWAKENNWDIEWPPNIDESQAIGRDGNELGLDVGIVVRTPTEDYDGPVQYRALICQCYYPEEDNFESPPLFKEKADSVNTTAASLNVCEGNEARREFIDKLLEVGILSEDGDDLAIDQDQVIGFYAFLGLKPKKDDGSLTNDAASIKALEDEGSLIVFDAEYLASRKWVEENPSGFPRPNEKTLTLAQPASETTDDVIVGVVSTDELFNFYKEDREESPWWREMARGKNQSLLDDNLRFQLEGEKAANKISNGMKTTLRENPSNFLKFNNGIVIIGSSVDFVEGREANGDHDEILERTQVKISQPSIVNGGQTTNAVFEMVLAAIEAGDEPPSGHIQIKIVETEDEGISKDVAKYANNQNTISSRDQHATDADQIEYHDTLIIGNYILWDYKRGLKAKLTGGQLEALKVVGKSSRTLDNTKVLQRYSAMIGLPELAYGSSLGIWDDECLVKFVFALNRTEELQIATGKPTLVHGEGANASANSLPIIRSGREEFCKDMILVQVICKLVEIVGLARAKKVKYVNNKPDMEISEDDKKRFEEQTIFHKHWIYGVIRAFALILNKYSVGEDDEGKSASRDTIRNELLGGEFWQNNVATNDFFRPTKSWSAGDWTTIDVDNTTHNILENADFCSKFPLMGLWLKGIEDLFRLIDVGQRNKQSHFSSKSVYSTFQNEITDVLGDVNRLNTMFPNTMPVAEGEFQDKLELVQRNVVRMVALSDWEGIREQIGDLEEMLQGVSEAQEAELTSMIGTYQRSLDANDGV